MKEIKSRLLGGVALCLLTLSSCFIATGCSQQAKANVAQQIVTWTPAVDSAVQTVASILEGLTPDPAIALVENVVASGLHGGGVLVSNAAKAYLANPTTGTLATLQTVVTSLQQSVNSALLQAAQIKDPASQQKVLAGVNGVGTIVTTIFALVQSISTQAQLKAMSNAAPIKFSQVQPYMDVAALNQAGAPYHVTADRFFAEEAQTGF